MDAFCALKSIINKHIIYKYINGCCLCYKRIKSYHLQFMCLFDFTFNHFLIYSTPLRSLIFHLHSTCMLRCWVQKFSREFKCSFYSFTTEIYDKSNRFYYLLFFSLFLKSWFSPFHRFQYYADCEYFLNLYSTQMDSAVYFKNTSTAQ